MTKKENISSKTKHNLTLKSNRLKKLEANMKANMKKRKKNTKSF